MLFTFLLAHAGEALLFQHALIITVPGHFLTSQGYSWLACWVHVFMYSRYKGTAYNFVTLLDKFEQTEVETRASFVPKEQSLSFPAVPFHPALVQQPVVLILALGHTKLYAQLLHLMLLPFCKASFPAL